MRTPNIYAIVQVRLDSTRLPRKALLDLNGYALIERVVQNLRRSKRLDGVVLAISDESSDDPLATFAKNKGIPLFRGDKLNVVRRFLGAVELADASVVVRVTGDSPFVSAEMADYLIEKHLRLESDYTAFDMTRTPEGTESEVLSVSAFRRLVEWSPDLSFSEYMTYYFTNNPRHFRIQVLPVPSEWVRPAFHLSVDDAVDFELARKVYSHFCDLGGSGIPIGLLIEFLDAHPEVVSMNAQKNFKYKTDEELIRKIRMATTLPPIASTGE